MPAKSNLVKSEINMYDSEIELYKMKKTEFPICHFCT